MTFHEGGYDLRDGKQVLRVTVALTLLIVALCLASCGFQPEGGGTDSGNGAEDVREGPDIRGRVTEIVVTTSSGAGGPVPMVGKILVEGEVEPDTSYDRAWVTVTPDTQIYRGPRGERVNFTAIKRGALVEVVFTGPVMESYPVQATASEVRILEEGG